MPFIIARVNLPVNIEQEQEIKARLGHAIESVPGKSEKYLMIGFEDKYHFWLRGDNSKPAAYIEVSIFGNEKHYGYEKLTYEITEAFNQSSWHCIREYIHQIRRYKSLGCKWIHNRIKKLLWQ